jgi:hypothetical protein
MTRRDRGSTDEFLSAASGDYTWDALEVMSYFDVVESGGGEEGFDIGLLVEAEFEGEIAAGDKGRVGGGDEAAVDFESVASAEEGDVRFVLADFYGDEGAIGVGDVGRIGDDDFEVLAADGGEEVALQEANVVCDCVAGCVLAGDGESGFGDVGRCERRVGKLSGEGNDDGAGAGAYVNDAEWLSGIRPIPQSARDGWGTLLGWARRIPGLRIETWGTHATCQRDDFLDEVFGFGAGD